MSATVSADLPRPAEATTRPPEVRPLQPSPADLEAQARADAERVAVTENVEAADGVGGAGEGMQVLAAGAEIATQSEVAPSTPIVSLTGPDRIPGHRQSGTDTPIPAESTVAPEPITAPAAPANPIDRDPRFRALVEAKSLQYLQSQDSAWFDSQYSGVAPSGYLIDKAGNETNFLPSQNIGGEYARMEAEARAEFSRLYPDAVPALGTTVQPAEARGTSEPEAITASPPVTETGVPPPDRKSQITQSATDIRILWPNLTPEQIAADPTLAHIAEDYSGDIDRFIQAREAWHRAHGIGEDYMNKDIASALDNIRHAAISDIGQDKAAQLISEARANISPSSTINQPASVDFQQILVSDSEYLKDLWPSLTPDQIKNNPLLMYIQTKLGGDIDRFIAEGKAQGRSDQVISETIARAKNDAVSALGGEYIADLIIQDARNRANMTPEEMTIALSKTISKDILNSLVGSRERIGLLHQYAYERILALRELEEARAKGDSQKVVEIQARIKKAENSYQNFLKSEIKENGYRGVSKEAGSKVASAEEELAEAEKSGNQARIIRAREMLEIAKTHQELVKKKRLKAFLWKLAELIFIFSFAAGDSGTKDLRENAIPQRRR